VSEPQNGYSRRVQHLNRRLWRRRQTAEPHRGFSTSAMPTLVSRMRHRGALIPMPRVVAAAAGMCPSLMSAAVTICLPWQAAGLMDCV